MARKKSFQSIYEDEDFSKPGIEIHPDAQPPKLEPIPDKAERRGAPRYKVEFETVIFHKGISFRATTINASISGVLLTESVPTEFVDQELDIVLIRNVGRNKEYYLMKGKSLGSPFRSPRIQFSVIQPVQVEKLEALFENCPKWL